MKRQSRSEPGARVPSADRLRPQDLPNGIGQQFRPELPAGPARRAIEEVDAPLRHRRRLRAESAGRDLAVDEIERGAAIGTHDRRRRILSVFRHATGDSHAARIACSNSALVIGVSRLRRLPRPSRFVPRRPVRQASED